MGIGIVMSEALPLQSQGPKHLWSLELNRGKGGEEEGVCRTEEIHINISIKFCAVGQCPKKLFCRTLSSLQVRRSRISVISVRSTVSLSRR